MRIVVAAPVVVLGLAAFVYGGQDDSPGLQLVGTVLVVSVLSALRSVLRTRAGRPWDVSADVGTRAAG